MAIEQKLRKLTPGLYGPLPTFFDDDQELDLVSYRKHLLNLATKGIGISIAETPNRQEQL
ncbi:hypothetical protein LTR17_010646 [Elasticomyces elasticus]|nr:hypothetical protein LTR17_010646 [Elasticomyces elasticus]